MSYSQYMAIIILLYKKGIRELIKNSRPISLINAIVKLISKIFAEKLKMVLPEIIHTDQKGCIKGRQTRHNIRLVKDIIHEDDDEKVIMLLDQQKAFDRVEWEWLFQGLDLYNFGESFIRRIMIMCTKI